MAGRTQTRATGVDNVLALIFTACAKGGSGNTSEQGFCAEMYFVCVEDVRLAYSRVLERVLKG